jgi:hypothetical protein
MAGEEAVSGENKIIPPDGIEKRGAFMDAAMTVGGTGAIYAGQQVANQVWGLMTSGGPADAAPGAPAADAAPTAPPPASSEGSE